MLRQRDTTRRPGITSLLQGITSRLHAITSPHGTTSPHGITRTRDARYTGHTRTEAGIPITARATTAMAIATIEVSATDAAIMATEVIEEAITAKTSHKKAAHHAPLFLCAPSMGAILWVKVLRNDFFQ